MPCVRSIQKEDEIKKLVERLQTPFYTQIFVFNNHNASYNVL